MTSKHPSISSIHLGTALEDWLEHDLSLLGKELLLIGRQIATPAGRIDLLAIDEDGVLVVIELKKDKTPREVVAQVLDYGSWVSSQKYEQIDRLYSATNQKSLAQAFARRNSKHLCLRKPALSTCSWWSHPSSMTLLRGS